MAPKKSKKDNFVAKVVEDGVRHPCSFCHHDVNDEILYGKLYSIGDIYCHYFCVLLSCCIVQKGEDHEGLLGFLYTDIKAELQRSKKHKCSYCGKEGATLGCVVTQCRKQFHVPCGHKKDAVSIFYGNYKSYCEKHAPRQKIPDHIMENAKQRLKMESKAKKNPTDSITTSPSKLYDDESPTKSCVCVLCYELVEGYPSPRTFWPSCCGTDQWFHRLCLQRMALTAGMHYLKCPLCNDKESFYKAIVEQGYYVPDRDAAWEMEQNAFSDMYWRQMQCCAEQCLCPDGLDRDDDDGEWCIYPCLLCGSVGVHGGCKGDTRYVCRTCAPVAPTDINALENEIANVIQEEKRLKTATAAVPAVTTGPIMPSRMSIRRTKMNVVKRPRYRPSTSGATLNSNQIVNATRPQEMTNTKLSRIELNLGSPKKLTRLAELNGQKSLESPIKNKENNVSVQSPMKIIEENVYSRIKEHSLGPNRLNLDCGEIFEKVKIHMTKPRPLSVKKMIANKILEDYLSEAVNLKSPLASSPIKFKISPSKAGTTTSNKQTNSQVTPKKCSPAVKEPSPPKQEAAELKYKQILSSTPEKVNETQLKATPLRNSQDIFEDDSSTSTFQLPPEFVADTLSDDFETPKKNKMADISTDSIKTTDKIQTPEKSNLQPEKTDILKNNSVFEALKSQYLDEVFSCEFNHNHVRKRKSPKLKTAMSFAVKAAQGKNKSETKEVALKRKLADDKTSKKENRRAKKQKKVSIENNLDLQIENTDNTAQTKTQYDKPKGKKSKNRKKKDKTQLSIRNLNIKLKIQIQKKKFKVKITQRKKKSKKKAVISSAHELKQSVINFSPDSSVQILRPVQDIIPSPKKRVKKAQNNDKLMQTSLHSFFKKESS